MKKVFLSSTIVCFILFLSFPRNNKKSIRFKPCQEYKKIRVNDIYYIRSFKEIPDNQDINISRKTNLELKIYGKALIYWTKTSKSSYRYNDLFFHKYGYLNCEECKTV